MQLQASDTISEEDNNDMALDAADDDDDDDDDDDAVSSNKASVDDNVARTERLLRLYFNLLAKSGTTHIVEVKFNLLMAKLGLVFK